MKHPLRSRVDGAPPNPDSCCALVADDDDDARELLTIALEREGFQVVSARDGNELLSRFTSLHDRGESMHIVISDIGMPDCDGLTATRRLRAHSSSLPILLVTAFTDAGTMRAARDAGADAVLHKPLDTREVMREVRYLMASTPS